MQIIAVQTLNTVSHIAIFLSFDSLFVFLPVSSCSNWLLPSDIK